MDAGHAGSGAAWLHGLDGRQGTAEKAAGFRLPIGVDDDGLSFADLLVVPFPDFGLDGLTHGCHMFEMVVVLGGFIRADFPQGADSGGRGMEDIDVQVLGDAPGATGVWIGGNAFVNNR